MPKANFWKSTPKHAALTDRLLLSLPPAPAGARPVIWDTVVPNFGIRVSDRVDPMRSGKAGGISFIVLRRMPGNSTPTRHTIGRYHPSALPLAKARADARAALGLITGGTKPLEEKRRQRRELVERRSDAFGTMAEDFIADMKRRELRNAGEFEAIIRREYLGQDGWRNTPLADIRPQDAARVIRGILARGGAAQAGRRRKSGGEWAAHHALAIGKTMFEWAIGQVAYGIESSPFERLRPKTLIGEKRSRTRILDDAELAAVWEASGQVGDPFGDLVRLLMLTGQRLSQAAMLQTSELDLDKAVWITPAQKMKATRAGSTPHATPLAPAAVDLLRRRIEDAGHPAGYVFSTTGGTRPFSGFSKAKIKLDKIVEAIRIDRAAKAGQAAPEAMMPWVLHDLRRTLRSGLPALGVPDTVAEAVLAHARPGIRGVYDLYQYDKEKRDALLRWAGKVKSIVNPPPPNVTPLSRRQRA
jgi:integrase